MSVSPAQPRLRRLWPCIWAAALLILAPPARAQSRLTRLTITTGGGSFSSSRSTLGLSLGQPVVGRMQGNTISLGFGYWQVQPNPVSGVADEIPAVFHLAQNVPNPFNPQTTITFDLPVPSRATLRLYDLRGHLVRTLVDTRETAGHKVFTWHGRDNQDQPAAAGVYFYVLEAGPFRSVRKMVLIR